MKIIVSLIALLALGIFAFTKEQEGRKNKASESRSGFHVIKSWDMPRELKEISGIAYMDTDRFACIQDEAGTVYVYNRREGKIEKEISFAAGGDFEGITLAGNTAYVIRSDGHLFEVDMNREKQQAKEYKTGLTAAENTEGVCYDAKNNRLLLTIKEQDPASNDYKGIYSFSLSTKTLQKEPAFRIDLNDEQLKESKKGRIIRPSEIGIHPKTGEIYITDGPGSRLLIMSAEGKISRLLKLGKGFVQPEGITFSPKGELFISNEGRKDPGNIIQVEITK
jgi:uncharacterized protein YjiK